MDPRNRSLRLRTRNKHPKLSSPRFRSVAAAFAAAALTGCAGATSMADPAAPLGLGGVTIVRSLPVDGQASRALPSPWAVSFDVRGPVTAAVGSQPVAIGLDGHGEASGTRAGRLVFSGHGTVTNLLLSQQNTPASLLLHRLLELHARLAPGAYPYGADLSDRLYMSAPDNWNSGFYEGALWRAAALEGEPFRSWALEATLLHLGHEGRPVADVGFMYGQSSLLAYEALCRHGNPAAALCAKLEHSIVAAADGQLRLAATNAKAGTVPDSPGGRHATTIIDDTMNISILPWASRLTGDPRYAQLARRHAKRIAALLVRPDGSTIQAVNFNRRTGRVISKATHQGISERSTWSRGQAWGVYGFAIDGMQLHSRALLRVSERLAQYVAGHLPAGGVPRWDYDAPAGAPLDVSAGVITSAGLFHLASGCRAMPGACRRSASVWNALARRMLAAALAYVSPHPPLGFLGSQELNEHAQGCWCNGAELTFGLSYALDAVGLARGA